MNLQSVVPGLGPLQALSLGAPSVRVAVLDGPVDLTHPCFIGADLTQLETLVPGTVGEGRMSRHGTHVASLIFGQPGSPVVGVAPRCRGLIVPIFRDFEEGRLPQLDLARAIEQAVHEGVDIINISGGERSPTGEADIILQRALRLCDENNVLVVAAAGNDGCPCLHVPAALPSVLAVGALGRDGQPLKMSNWGEAYRTNGVLAAGEDIVGAVPGGGLASFTGTSFSTPIVSGVLALLLSSNRQTDTAADPRLVAEAILRTASKCQPIEAPECEPFLGGIVDIPQAVSYLETKGVTTVADLNAAQTQRQETEAVMGQVEPSAVAAAEPEVPAAAAGIPGSLTAASGPPTAPPASASAHTTTSAAASGDTGCNCQGVKSSGGCNCHDHNGHDTRGSYVYALGRVGFDYGTDARRDTFRQLMPDVVRTDPRAAGEGEEVGPTIRVVANPYDVFQLYDYLESRPSECTKLIWTMNLDLTPIYAVEAEVSYPEDVYKPLRDALRFQQLPTDDDDFVARLSVPGVLTNRTVQLFSGQIVPVIRAQPRGLYMWNETLLVRSVIEAVQVDVDNIDVDYVSKLVRTFLDKIYFQCRNLGQSPPDRALNFAATNAYQFASGIAQGLLSGRLVPGAEEELYTLDTIDVSKSPYCRLDSDCWDVRIKFFDPVNDRRAKSVYQFTIDVSDPLPVSLAPAHQFLAT